MKASVGSVGWKKEALHLIGVVYKDRQKEIENKLREMEINELLNRFILPFLPKDVNLSVDPDANVINYNLTINGNGKKKPNVKS